MFQSQQPPSSPGACSRTRARLLRAVLLAAAAVILLSAIGCAVSDQSGADPGYTVKEVPFHSSLEDAPEAVDLRFYEDLPDIPFSTIDAVFATAISIAMMALLLAYPHRR